MKISGIKMYLLFFGIGFYSSSTAQTIAAKLTAAINHLQNDNQFKHATLSMYVADAATGKALYEVNAQIGMAPASCQKVVTSIAAFDVLGKDYTYKTNITYSGEIKDGVLNGSIHIAGSGDPTLGSWRWKHTKDELLLKQIADALTAKGIKKITGDIIIESKNWDTNITPDGWIWQDIGNYYGAGAAGFNWHENQYDLVLKSGNAVGDKVSTVAIKPPLENVTVENELRTGPKGSGDNAYIYLPAYSDRGYVRGTIPAGESTFTISGSMPNPANQFYYILKYYLASKNISVPGNKDASGNSKQHDLITFESPAFDSMVYWFLKKSINLYGEAFVKTIAMEKKNVGSSDSGIALIREFWSNRGIDKAALKIIDASGLSPANRVTTNALVNVMQYALKQPWFASFYEALPEMNGIKMKDGYINGVRSYTGYIKDGAHTKYVFSFMVNNFDGSPGTVREKMWRVLNILK